MNRLWRWLCGDEPPTEAARHAEVYPHGPACTFANGQSNGEYATVIMEIMGIKDAWKVESDQRRNLEALVALIKHRTYINVLFSLEAEKAIGGVQRFLKDNGAEP